MGKKKGQLFPRRKTISFLSSCRYGPPNSIISVDAPFWWDEEMHPPRHKKGYQTIITLFADSPFCDHIVHDPTSPCICTEQHSSAPINNSPAAGDEKQSAVIIFLSACFHIQHSTVWSRVVSERNESSCIVMRYKSPVSTSRRALLFPREPCDCCFHFRCFSAAPSLKSLVERTQGRGTVYHRCPAD